MLITLYTKVAVERVKQNRDKHISEFEGQIKGWQEAMKKYQEELNAWASNVSKDAFAKDNTNTRPQEPLKPESYVKAYDRLIELLICNVTETIQVEEHEFDQIVKDEFGWKPRFLANSATYNSVR